MKPTSLILALFLAQSSFGSTIAVIDSGTDFEHPELSSKAWTNPIDIDDAVDNDDNGYIDDIHGWNFAESNNKLIDKKYLGTFSADVYKFFEVQTRMLKGEATAEDTAWMQAARSNATLIGELGTFGNFVHGTHVAGITARNNNKAQIVGMKLIATKSPIGGGHKGLDIRNPASRYFSNAGGSDTLIKAGLKLLAAQQGKGLAPIGAYVAQTKVRIANCSFGTSTNAAKSILGPILKLALRRDATAEEITTYSAFFVGEVVKNAGAMIDPAKGKTLFVIAAGNDGENNDLYPTSPANYKKDNNTISVAATLAYKKLASFSNYGSAMVDVAAPGVGIESSIPGNLHLTVSGTSQAAPFVANVVSMMVDENPSLSNSEIKRVLMETSDLKEFLKDKVMSSGIVNTNRAVLAAKLAKSMQLTEALQASRLQVADVSSSKMNEPAGEGFVIPLPSLFQ